MKLILFPISIHFDGFWTWFVLKQHPETDTISKYYRYEQRFSSTTTGSILKLRCGFQPQHYSHFLPCIPLCQGGCHSFLAFTPETPPPLLYPLFVPNTLSFSSSFFSPFFMYFFSLNNCIFLLCYINLFSPLQ